MSQVEKLREDLERKLESLRWANDNPLFFVLEHFFELRNNIDIEAETLINDIRDAERIDKINETRFEFLRILKENEDATLKQFKISKLSESSSSSESLEALEKRFKFFKDSLTREDDVDEIEDAYVELALDLMKERDNVEKRLLGEQKMI